MRHKAGAMGKSCRLLKRFALFLRPDSPAAGAAGTAFDDPLMYGMPLVLHDSMYVLEPPAGGSRFALDCEAFTWRVDELVGMFVEVIWQEPEPKWEGFEADFRETFQAPVARAE
jgi:hypothetical protein